MSSSLIFIPIPTPPHRSTVSDTNASRDYLHLLTRIPDPVVDTATTRAAQQYDGVINLLLRQPPEIRQLILNWLEVRDILNLRATSHSLHTFIHDSERGICVHLAEHIAKAYSLNHLSIPVNDLFAFCAMTKWYYAICEVSDHMASRTCESMTLRLPSTRDEVLVKVRSRTHTLLKWRLTRSFIILQYYLKAIMGIMLENEEHLSSLSDDMFAGLFNIFDIDQQQFLSQNMAGLTEEDFIDVTASWHAFKAECKAKRISFFSRILTFCSVTIKHIFMYDGFLPFASLLEKDQSPSDQQTTLKHYDQRRKRRNLIRDEALLDSIQHLNIRKETLRMDFLCRRSSKAREAFINNQDIWNRASRALMMRKLGAYPIIKSPSEWVYDLVSSVENGRDVVYDGWSTG